MTFKIIQKIGRFFTKNSEVAMNNGKKATHNIQQNLEQKADEFVPESKKVMDGLMKAIDNAEAEEFYVPASVTDPRHMEGITVRKVKFFPEDIAKMEKMTVEDRIKYKGELKEQGKYIKE